MNMNCEPNDAASESAASQSTVRHIALDRIKVGLRRRQINPERIADLADSMRDQGQLQPIIVFAHEGRYELIAGNRRLEAAHQLGWKAIRAEVLDGLDADSRALVEIDENLKRDDLSKSERAAHIAGRKEIYERLHPETRVGATGRKGRKICDDKTTDRFTKDTAAKTGRSERSVQLDAKRGKHERIKETIGTSLDKGDELDALAEITEVDPVKANELIDRAKAGKKVSAKAEAAKTKPPHKTKSIASTMTVDGVTTRAPQQDDSIALQQAQADLKQSQADLIQSQVEVERLSGKVDAWNQSVGDGGLETPMAVMAMLDAIFAKAQVENFWGDASTESVNKLIVTLGAAVTTAYTIRSDLNKAEANTASVN